MHQTEVYFVKNKERENRHIMVSGKHKGALNVCIDSSATFYSYICILAGKKETCPIVSV